MRLGRRAGSRALVVHLAVPPAPTDATDSSGPGAQRDPARAGLVVSKAVGNAVVRTRVKRRLRHQLAARLDRVPLGATVVVRALPP
ncbi:ribonuclease P protein component, partial [Nocardioides sp.]|uniref:ribonuclease P protein component n=1 Tax=Nocardioides sp. TaxID=35761 RepID=UPI0035621DA7